MQLLNDGQLGNDGLLQANDLKMHVNDGELHNALESHLKLDLINQQKNHLKKKTR